MSINWTIFSMLLIVSGILAYARKSWYPVSVTCLPEVTSFGHYWSWHLCAKCGPLAASVFWISIYTQPLLVFSTACSCDPQGSEHNNCSPTGHCQCRPNYTGLTCNQCASGFYGFPSCICKSELQLLLHATRGSTKSFQTEYKEDLCRLYFLRGSWL